MRLTLLSMLLVLCSPIPGLAESTEKPQYLSFIRSSDGGIVAARLTDFQSEDFEDGDRGWLRKLASVEELTLSHHTVTKLELSKLAEIVSPTYLTLGELPDEIELGKNALDGLAGVESIVELSIGAAGLTKGDFLSLLRIRNIKVLSLSGGDITPNDVELIQSMNKLQELHVTGHFNPTSWQTFRNIPSLRQLEICTSVDDNDLVSQFMNLDSLVRLEIVAPAVHAKIRWRLRSQKKND